MVKEYLEWDLEYESRAHKYKISSHTPITEWVRQFKLYGIQRLERKQNQEYTSEFKLNVLNYMRMTCATYTGTAIKCGVPHIGAIAI